MSRRLCPATNSNDEAELGGVGVADDAVEVDDVGVPAPAACGLVEAGLPQQLLAGVGGDLRRQRGQGLDGDGLARGAVASLVNDAEGALAEEGRLLVVSLAGAGAGLLMAASFLAALGPGHVLLATITLLLFLTGWPPMPTAAAGRLQMAIAS
jgi:hypothetical protein